MVHQRQIHPILIWRVVLGTAGCGYHLGRFGHGVDVLWSISSPVDNQPITHSQKLSAVLDDPKDLPGMADAIEPKHRQHRSQLTRNRNDATCLRVRDTSTQNLIHQTKHNTFRTLNQPHSDHTPNQRAWTRGVCSSARASRSFHIPPVWRCGACESGVSGSHQANHPTPLNVWGGSLPVRHMYFISLIIYMVPVW